MAAAVVAVAHAVVAATGNGQVFQRKGLREKHSALFFAPPCNALKRKPSKQDRLTPATLLRSPVQPPSPQSRSLHPDAPVPVPSCSSPAASPDQAAAPIDRSSKNSPSARRCSAPAALRPPPPRTPLHSSIGGCLQPLAKVPALPPCPPRRARPP